MTAIRYELFRGERLIGIVDHTDDDFPWHLGTFTPGADVDDVLALFADELARLGDGGVEDGRWRTARDALDAPGLRLRNVESGQEILKPLLHIRGSHAWWR